MKFGESSLAEYLVKNLRPLTEADPVILSEYVVALLKKDKSTKELQNLCTESLVEFLGQNTRSFITKLFQALEDGSIVRADGNLDAVKKTESSQPVMAVETPQLKYSPKEKKRSSSSEPISDPEEKEISDDDDRNHKHRRREARPGFPHNDVEEQPLRRPNKKRSKPYDDGHVYLESDPQTSGKEYNPTLEKNISLKLDKRHSVSGPLLRAPVDFGPRTRLGQPFRSDSGPRFDLSACVGRLPAGRGRGRSAVSWSQHDSRFSNPLDTLDYASRMASHGSGHPNLFGGAGFPSAASAQNTSWSGFGFIPGMANGILDPIHPLGLNGALRPTIAPPLNLGIPRQRCRDFEERGFCLRGDMCPMEHGLNRIVVEDVQSLSQFNLPVSIPSSSKLGVQAGSGTPTTVPAPPSLLTNSKGATSKSEAMDDAVKPNGASSTSGGGDADIYDPDQPLWNIDRPNTSTDLLMLPSSNVGDEALWNADDSARHNLRLSDGIESDITGRSATTNRGEKNKTSTVWGRIGSKFKSESENRSNCGMTSAGYHGNEIKEGHEEVIPNSNASNLYTRNSNTETGSKATAIQSVPRPFADSGYRSHRPSSKASRTLYVYGIPQTDNKWNALFSHFKKFGKVVHIYVPPNSEKAFVQFTKREEAEAALKSPDAVMGNRFIKLSWANHDRVPVEVQSSAHTKSGETPSVMVPSVSSQQQVCDGGKEIHPSSSQKRRHAANASTIEAPISVSGLPKALLTNVPISAPPVPKKVENLELLEEIRRKQEILDKKRDEFRRQLEKIEKQAISIKKGEAVSEQAVKRHIIDLGSEATKTTDPRNSYSLQKGQDTQKTVEKRESEESLVSPSSKVNLATLQQSRKNMNKTNSMTAPLLNRFKLDNRSTSFRILPPLPGDFANVAVLKDHFSRFGVISSIVLEEPEAHTENVDSKSCNNCSASISFSNRHSAEKAYQTGKCWEGHNLQFKWLTVTPNSSSSVSCQEALSLQLDQNAEVQTEPVTAASTPVNAVKPTCGLSSEIVAVRNKEPNMGVESTNCASISLLESPLPTSQSDSTMPLGDRCPHESDTPRVEGSINDKCCHESDTPKVEGSINASS
ncbi:zinc finger CCCH domain-containing protein 27 [Iris pallida]|uniref:Zinc finger CCCH domain-containing protein 27 n=1 Tax=Iris pallida TaxID=29817 RepID=A0AAX6DUP2_IRIPA|nr:zinc finger CCCH domain-containing protein 27 [Iris pallida]